MYSSNHERYQFAEQLYSLTDKSIPEIAELTGIPKTTLYERARKYSWTTQKRAVRRSPIVIVEEMYRELSELNSKISRRPEKQRIATREEAELRRKILASIAAIKKYPTHAEVNMIMQSLKKYIKSSTSRHEEFAKLIDAFMCHRDIYGFASVLPEHGVDLNMPAEQDIDLIFGTRELEIEESPYNYDDPLDSHQLDRGPAINKRTDIEDAHLLDEEPGETPPTAHPGT